MRYEAQPLQSTRLPTLLVRRRRLKLKSLLEKCRLLGAPQRHNALSDALAATIAYAMQVGNGSST